MGAKKVLPLVGILGIGGLATYYYNQSGEVKNMTPLSQSSFAPKTPEELAEIERVKEEAIAEYKEENEPIVNTWDEWLPNIYGSGYFKDFINDEHEEDNPFKSSGRRLVGGKDWINNSEVRLKDYDMWYQPNSGGIKLKVKKGFEVLLTITTENGGYFKDDVKRDGGSQTLISYVSGLGETADGGSGGFFGIGHSNSKITIPLSGDYGDYLSIDTDSEHSNISKFAVRSMGKKFKHDGTKVNDETNIRLDQVRRRNPDYDASRFSAESYTFRSAASAAGKLDNLGGIAKAWKTFTNALSAINPIRRLGGGARRGAVISQTSLRVGDDIMDGQKSIGKAQEGYKITQGMLSSGDPSDLRYVSSYDDAKGLSKLDDGVVVLREGKLVKGSSAGKGLYKLRSGDELFKVADAGASGGSKLGNVINIRNAYRSVLITTTGGIVYGIVSIAGLIPGIVGDEIEEFACSLTGSCCEERCEGSENPTCVEDCKKEAEEKAIKFGGLAILGVLGLVVVLRSGKSSKEAEEYHILRRG